jgi:putative transposase
MGKYRRLSHVVYQCTYHVVWVPKYRYRILTGAVAELMDRDIRMLCEWKDVEVLELNVQVDHIHALLSIPPKISVSTFMGFLKGKLAIKVMKSYPRLRKKPYWGNHFLGAGVLREHGWVERRSHSPVCPIPRGARAARRHRAPRL